MSSPITGKKIQSFNLDNYGLDYRFSDGSGGRINARNKDSNYIRSLINLQKLYTGDLYRRPDGTIYLKNQNGAFFGSGRALNAKTGKMENYDMNTGHFASYSAPAAQNLVNDKKVTAPAVQTTDYSNYKSRQEAWKAARDAKKGIFTWRGKTYNTLGEGEDEDAFRQTHADYDFFMRGLGHNVGGWTNQKNGAAIAANYNQKASDDILRNKARQLSTSDSFVNRITPKPTTPNLSTSLSSNIMDSAKQSTQQAVTDTVGHAQWDRSQTRDWLRQKNINPYELAGSERRALRHYLSGDTTGANYNLDLLKNLNTKYNFGFKFQQGGQINMNEQQQMQQAFLQYLAQQTGVQSQEELEQVIQQMGEDGVKQAYQQFLQEMQQQQVQAAKFGAKLAYINRLKGKCPEGTYTEYYQKGGKVCKRCAQMEAMGGNLESGNAVQQFRKDQKKKTGYLANRKDLTNMSKLQRYNNHVGLDRDQMSPAQKHTQDSLVNKAKADGSWGKYRH